MGQAVKLRGIGFTFTRQEKYADDSALVYLKDKKALPAIELGNLQELVELSERFGEIVLNAEKMSLRIYDDHE